MCRSREELVVAVAEILDNAGVQQSLKLGQRILDDIATDHYLRPREPLKGRTQLSPVERRERLRKQWRNDDERMGKLNNETIDTARNRWQEWTSHELEVASREDLSALEVANMLGRTLYGVKKARKRLKYGPPGRRGDAPRWTGPELELAARNDLTAAQVAEMTGRSPNAVDKIRTALRRDPRKWRAL
jgi:hypothetical protein